MISSQDVSAKVGHHQVVCVFPQESPEDGVSMPKNVVN
jgi:hypothetical protein